MDTKILRWIPCGMYTWKIWKPSCHHEWNQQPSSNHVLPMNSRGSTCHLHLSSLKRRILNCTFQTNSPSWKLEEKKRETTACLMRTCHFNQRQLQLLIAFSRYKIPTWSCPIWRESEIIKEGHKLQEFYVYTRFCGCQNKSTEIFWLAKFNPMIQEAFIHTLWSFMAKTAHHMGFPQWAKQYSG